MTTTKTFLQPTEETAIHVFKINKNHLEDMILSQMESYGFMKGSLNPELIEDSYFNPDVDENGNYTFELEVYEGKSDEYDVDV